MGAAAGLEPATFLPIQSRCLTSPTRMSKQDALSAELRRCEDYAIIRVGHEDSAFSDHANCIGVPFSLINALSGFLSDTTAICSTENSNGSDVPVVHRNFIDWIPAEIANL